MSRSRHSTRRRPGSRLRAIAARVCSGQTMARLIDPVIADLQTEYTLALGHGAIWRRWWTLLVGYGAFAQVAVWCALLGVRDARRNWTGEDRHGLLHTLWLSGCAIVIVSMPLWLLELPVTRDMMENSGRPSFSLLGLMTYLLPAILPFSVPAGLAMGVGLSAQRRALSRRLIAGIILVALAASAVSAVNVGWLSPATNQLYREAIAGSYVARGSHEFTIPELNRLAQPAGYASLEGPSDRQRMLIFEFHQRLGLAIAPLTYCVFGLVLVIRRLSGRVTLVAAVSAAIVGYLLMRGIGNSLSVNESVSPQLGAWLPQITLVAVTVVAALRTGRLKAAATSR